MPLQRAHESAGPIDFVLLNECVDVSDKDGFLRLMTIFFEQVPEAIRDIRRAIAQRQKASVREIAHRVKGSSLALAALPLSQLFQVVENAGQSGDFTTAEEMLTPALAEFESAKKALMTLSARQEQQ